jgi:predicted lipoprotein
MQRRTLLRLVAQASALGALPACRRSGRTQDVLRALVEQVLVPNIAAVAESSRQLEDALARLAEAPSVATLRGAREEWQRALLSWKRAEVFRQGPITEANSSLRVMFWPVRADALDALAQGSAAIDDAAIDAMGVDHRGLFALEYLLYSAQADEQIAVQFASPEGARRGLLARSLASNISFQAQRAARSLADGKKLADELAEGSQESLSRLVASMIDRVENVSARRLARTSELARSGRLVPSAIEGGVSGTSQQIALAYLRATEQLYLGVQGASGLSALVNARSIALDQALRAAFRDAIVGVDGLGLPLEVVAVREAAKLDSATSVVRKLERALKTELTSTLGLTLTFSSLDGD